MVSNKGGFCNQGKGNFCKYLTLPVMDIPTLVPLLAPVLIVKLLSLPKLLHGLLSCSCLHKLLKVTLMQLFWHLLKVFPVIDCILPGQLHLSPISFNHWKTQLLSALTKNAPFDNLPLKWGGIRLVLLIHSTFLP